VKRAFLVFVLGLVISAPASAQWTSSVSTDEMTGKRQAYAHSPQVGPTRPMPFPYTGTRAWLGFGCNGQDEWAYVGFSNQPNLINTETRDGYHAFSTRVKFDDQVYTMDFTQKWGDSFLEFDDDEATIARILTTGSALLELDWYSSGVVYFRFSLRGSSAAIAKARAVCFN